MESETKRIEIETIYPDHDDPDDFIVHCKDGNTYLIRKKEMRKIKDLV